MRFARGWQCSKQALGSVSGFDSDRWCAICTNRHGPRPTATFARRLRNNGPLRRSVLEETQGRIGRPSARSREVRHMTNIMHGSAGPSAFDRLPQSTTGQAFVANVHDSAQNKKRDVSGQSAAGPRVSRPLVDRPNDRLTFPSETLVVCPPSAGRCRARLNYNQTPAAVLSFLTSLTRSCDFSLALFAFSFYLALSRCPLAPRSRITTWSFTAALPAALSRVSRPGGWVKPPF